MSHTEDHCPYCNSRRLQIKQDFYVGRKHKYDLCRCKDCHRIFEQWFKITFVSHQIYKNRNDITTI